MPSPSVTLGPAAPPAYGEGHSEANAGRRIPRLRAACRRVSPDGWALAAITVVVLLANLPYLVGYFDPNPLGPRSGLATSVTPGWLGGKPTIDPNVGYSSQAIGHLAALDLLHLHLPWWNPYEGTGMPLVGETQAAALFPLTLLTAFSGGQLYEHILLELIAGICTYRLLRRIRITRWAAGAGAVAFALNGSFAWFAHASVNPVPFLPMLLLGIERAFAATTAKRRGGWRLIALAGALSIYAGFPEVAYIDALMGVCWIGWRCGCLERSQLRAFVTKAALGAAAGTLLAAPMLLAMNGYLSHAYLGVHSTAQLGTEHLGGDALPQLLMPYVYGPINGDPRAEIWIMVGGYLSTGLLLFTLLGVLARGRRGLKFVVLGWAVLVFARMYGQPPLLGHALGVLPDMQKIAVFRYGTPALELSIVVLAALGLDDMTRVPEHQRRLLWGAPAAFALLIAAAFGSRPMLDSLGSGLQHHSYFTAAIVWGALIPAAAACLVLLPKARLRVPLLATLLVCDMLALFAVPEFSAPRASTIDSRPVAYLRRHLGDSRFFTLGPIQPNYGSYFGLASLNINDFPPKEYGDYVHTRLDPVVNPSLFVGNNGGWRPRGQPSATQQLLRHLDGYRAAAVRYVLAPAAQPLPQSPTTLKLVFGDAHALIYQVVGATRYFSAVGCRLSSAERARARVACGQPTTLVRRETWFPGWSAQLDGRPVSIRRWQRLFQAVKIPPGTHRVVFSFAPPGLGWAGLAMLAGCALMCAPKLSRRRLGGLIPRRVGGGRPAS